MYIAYPSIPVDDVYGGHPARQERDMLGIQVFNFMLRVGQPRERHVMAAPEIVERGLVLGADGYNVGISLEKIIIIATQLRHMPAAVRSHESAVENQYHVFAPEIR